MRRKALKIMRSVIIGVATCHIAFSLYQLSITRLLLLQLPLSGTYQYFAEVEFNYKSKLIRAVSHNDSRYASRRLDITQLRRVLDDLLRSYISTMNDLGIETWI